MWRRIRTIPFTRVFAADQRDRGLADKLAAEQTGTVHRNLNDIRAAFGHARANMRLPFSPKVKDIDQRYRSAA